MECTNERIRTFFYSDYFSTEVKPQVKNVCWTAQTKTCVSRRYDQRSDQLYQRPSVISIHPEAGWEHIVTSK